MSKHLTLDLDLHIHTQLEDVQHVHARRYSLTDKLRKDKIGLEIFELGLIAFIAKHKLKV